MADTSVGGQSTDAPELVEILKALSRHRQKAWERAFGDESFATNCSNLEKAKNEFLKAVRADDCKTAGDLLCRFVDAAHVKCSEESRRQMLADLASIMEARRAARASGNAEFNVAPSELGPEVEEAFAEWSGIDPKESAAWWHHPLRWLCREVEERLGIEREDLEIAAYRLTSELGLRGMGPLIAPDGTPDDDDKGQPDWLWMLPKFKELDRDGTTARLWQGLLEKFSAVLVEAKLAPVAGATLSTATAEQNERNGWAGSGGPAPKGEIMATQEPAPVDPQDDRTFSIVRGQTGGIVFLPSESSDAPETMPADVYFAWMEKVSPLKVCRQPLPEAVAVWLELVLDCVKNFPRNYCIQTLRRLGERFPRILDIRKDVLKRRDEFAVCALGPVNLGQQYYSSAHEAIVELAHTFYRQLVPEFVNFSHAPKALARHLDRVRAYLCNLPESLSEQIRAAKAQLARERELLAKLKDADDDKTPWCHSHDEPKPERFCCGPLTGTADDLDAATCQRKNPDPNHRQLKRRGTDGHFWIVKLRRTCFEVWFRDDGSYRTAARRLEVSRTAVANSRQRASE